MPDRVSLNPTLTYFSSLGDIEDLHMDEKDFRQNYASSLLQIIKYRLIF